MSNQGFRKHKVFNGFRDWLSSLNKTPSLRHKRVRQKIGAVEVLENRCLLTVDLNDQFSEATDLGTLTQTFTQTGFAIDDPEDVDMFRINMTAGQRITIDLDRPTGSTLDSYLILFNSNGVQVAINDDGPTPGESSSVESYIDFTSSSGGVFFLGVSGFGNSNYNPITGDGDTSGSTGAFTLVITPSGGTTSSDPDDQLSEAISLGTLSQTLTRNDTISSGTDVDMFGFTVTAGQRVTFDIDRPAGSTLDSFIRLFDSNGQQLAANDDGPNPSEGSSVESFLDFTFTNGGTFFLGVGSFGNTSYSALTGDGDSTSATSKGDYSLVITPSGGTTSSDPDDQLSEAIPLGTLSQTLTRNDTISSGTDVDMFGFAVTAGQRVTFDIDRPAGSTLDSFIRLFDSNGQQLAANDDGPNPSEGSSVESFLDFTFTSGGTFFLGVGSFGNTSYSALTGDGDSTSATSKGDYSLVITPSGGTTSNDPDDQLSEAIPLGTLSQTLTRNDTISSGTDVDMFGFTVTSGQRVTFDVDRPAGSTLDSFIRLFDSNGQQLAANDDGPNPSEGSSLESYLDFTFTNGGTFFLGVGSFGNTTYSAVTGDGDSTTATGKGDYSLVITPSGGTTSSDSDDQLSEAIPLGTLSQTLTRNDTISSGADVDMFGFTVTAGQRVTFDIDRPAGSTLDSFIRLFDSNGQQLAANDDGPNPSEGSSVESYLDFTFTNGGTFFLGVGSFGNTSYSALTGDGDSTSATSKGDYSLVITPSGGTTSSDLDDQLSEAISLGTLSQTLTRNDTISSGTDVDMFGFTVTAGQRVTFDIDRPAGSTLDSFIRLFDSNGAQLAFNDDGPNPSEGSSVESFLDFTFTNGGTFFLGVGSFGNTSYSALTGDGDSTSATSKGDYSLVITPSGGTTSSDPDDQLSEAISLGTLSQTLTRTDTISSGTDVDMFGFTVTAGQRVTFDIDRPAGSTFDSFIRLFSSSGAQLTFNDDGPTPGETGSSESFIDFTFTSAGTFFLGVSGFGNSSYNAVTGDGDGSGSTGAYILVVTPSGGTTSSDPDDQLSEAIPLGTLSQTLTRNDTISSGTDVDMFGFTVTSGQRVTFDIDRPAGSTLDSFIRLFDSNGSQLAFNDDGPNPSEGSSVESFLDFTFTNGGTFFLGVGSFGNTSYSALTGDGDSTSATSKGDYSLVITPSGGTTSNDPDDQLSEAIPLGTLSQTLTRNDTISSGTDVDMFGFTVTAGQRVTFDIDRPAGSTLDSFIRLFDSNGAQMASNDDGPNPSEGSSVESYLDFTFTNGGTFFLGVGSFGNSGYSALTGDGDSTSATSKGDYSLVIVPSGGTTSGDPDDQLSEAIPLGALSQTLTRNDTISVGTDVDMFGFTVTAGQRVTFDIDRPAGSTLDSYIRLFDANGVQVAFNDDGPNPSEGSSVESYLDFTFTNAGTFFLGVSGFGNSSYSPVTGSGDSSGSTGAYSLVLTATGGSTSNSDSDDQLSEAIPLGPLTQTQTLSDTISVATDVDMYTFKGTAGQRVSFDIDRPAGSTLDSFIRLFDSNGVQLASNDDGPTPGEGSSVESYLEFTLTSSGPFFLGVSGFGNSTYNAVSGDGDQSGSSGAYTLVVSTVTGTVNPDPDDQISEATPLGALTSSQSRSDTISIGTDVDMYSFQVTAGQRVAFSAIHTSPPPSLNTYLRLFDINGNELAFNDDGTAPGAFFSPGDSYLEFSFTTAGTFFVGVSGSGNAAYNAITGGSDTSAGSADAYTLTVTPLAATSGSDPDDQLSEAIVLGQLSQVRTVSGDSISTGTDVDMYSFQATAGQRITFDIDRPSGSTLDSFIRLFDSSGVQLAFNDDGPTPGEGSSVESFLDFTFTNAGTFFLGVSGFGNSGYNAVTGAGDGSGSSGAYTLILTPSGGSTGSNPDPDDQLGEATSLGSLTTQVQLRNDSISAASDVDMFSFQATAGQRIAFNINRPPSGTFDSYLRLFDSTGAQLAFNDDGPAPGEGSSVESYLEFTFTATGTFFLGVSGFGNSAYNAVTGEGDSTSASIGAYSLAFNLVSGTSSSDPDDQLSEASQLGALLQVQTRNGSISVGTDVDMYAIQVSAGQRVSFNVIHATPAFSPNLDPYLRLFDSNGTELAFNDNTPIPQPPLSTTALDPYLEFTFATSGTFFVGVSGSGNPNYNPITGDGDTSGTSNSTGDYMLLVTPLSNGTNPDPDDQLSEAASLGALTQPRTLSDSVSVGTDVDMYSFQVTAGQRVSFNINRPAGGTFDSFIRLFDSSGAQLAANDDGPTPGEGSSVESFLDFTFTNAGTFFLGVSGFGNSSYNAVTGTGDNSGSAGEYSLVVTPSGGTVNTDPDDQLSEAISLGALSQSQLRNDSISVATDVDMYSFQVTAGQRVSFNINRPPGGTFDSYIRLFDSSGTQLAANDDGPTPGEGSSVESFLDFTFTSAGTFFLGVSGFGNSSYNAVTGAGDNSGSAGEYSLVVTPSGGAVNTDPDDQLSEALSLGALGQALTRNDSISVGTDVDMYSFQVTAGQRVSFNINRPAGSTLDSFIRLFDSSGAQLAANDDGPTPGEGSSVESFLDFTFTNAGTFFLGVSGFGNSGYNAVTGAGDNSGSTGGYSLVVTPSGGTVNTDPDDQLSEAISLGALSQSQLRNDSISVATDVDMYSFQVTAGQRVSFNINRPPGGTLDSYIRLFDSSGTQLAANDDGPTPGEGSSVESFLDFTFTSAGTFFLGVSGFGNSSYNAVTGGGDGSGSTGEYSLLVTSATTDPDPDDQISQAIPLGTLTQSQTRTGESISVGTDVDMYSFQVTAGQRIAFNINRPNGSSLDSFIRLFGAIGNQLALNDDGPTPGESNSVESYLEFTFTTSGTFFLGVSGYGNSDYSAVTGDGDRAGSTGAYTIVATPVTSAVQDDAFEDNDTRASASDLGTLTATRTISNLVMADSADWYKFTMNGTGTLSNFVQISFTHANGNLDMSLSNSSGQEIARSESTSNSEQFSLQGLAAGTYFVKVSGVGGAFNPNYSLTIAPPGAAPPTAGDDSFEENDTLAQASDLGTVTGLRTITTLVMADDHDWFSFTTTATGTANDFVQINFLNALGNLDLELYTPNGGLIGTSNGLTDSQRLSLDRLNAGQYFIHVFGDQLARNPSYSLTIQAPTPVTPPVLSDDIYEENDTAAQAADLGLVTSEKVVEDLRLLDSADWFRFTTNRTGTNLSYVRIAFDQSQGNLDLALWNSAGTQRLGLSANAGGGDAGNSQQVSLAELPAGEYKIQVFGHNGARNPNYSLVIEPAPAPLPATGAHVLYVNFDGATISNSDLRRWAGTDWRGSISYLDPEGDGIRVSSFGPRLSSTNRDTVIAGIMRNLQADLDPFGITVQRTTGLAVENQFATTIFVGEAGSTLEGKGGVACDVDFGNNNLTDIAFAMDETVFGNSLPDLIMSMSDVILHEAGHTYGLYHVNSGNALESMGLRYSVPFGPQWFADTSFLNQTFPEFVGANGVRHGGGAGPENTFQTMRSVFGSGPGTSAPANFNNAAAPLSQSEIFAQLMDDALFFPVVRIVGDQSTAGNVTSSTSDARIASGLAGQSVAALLDDSRNALPKSISAGSDQASPPRWNLAVELDRLRNGVVRSDENQASALNQDDQRPALSAQRRSETAAPDFDAFFAPGNFASTMASGFAEV